MRIVRSLLIGFLGALLLIALGVGVGLYLQRPPLSEEEVRQTVVTTLQRETPAAFLVTGELDITATVSIENTRYLLPEIVNFDMGTTRASVRVPGRVSYGLPVESLQPDMIRVLEDGTIEIDVPRPVVYAVEPDLSRMEVETTIGWARTQSGSGRQAEQRAMILLKPALLTQANAHLEDATQPRINTARALRMTIVPILEAAGWPDPRLRFYLGDDLVLDPESPSSDVPEPGGG